MITKTKLHFLKNILLSTIVVFCEIYPKTPIISEKEFSMRALENSNCVIFLRESRPKNRKRRKEDIWEKKTDANLKNGNFV